MESAISSDESSNLACRSTSVRLEENKSTKKDFIPGHCGDVRLDHCAVVDWK